MSSVVADPERLIKSEANPRLLSQVEVYNEREGGLIEAMVPIDLIRRDEVPVDDNHVQELALSMSLEQTQGTIGGQLSPVLLGEVPGEDKFRIIDGFHRDAAQKLLGNEQLFATIRPNSSEEEILDLRILTANTHTTVSFARIYEWVSDAWKKSPWAGKLDASQAFSLASNKKMNGRYIGLSPEETEAVRTWALDKCEKWRTSAGNIYSVMSTAQVADPDLVVAARSRASGHELPTLTPQHLGVIAKAFPLEYASQRAIAKLTTDRNLTVENTKKMVNYLQTATPSGLDGLHLTIEQTDWDSLLKKAPRVRKTESGEEEISTDSDSWGIQTKLLLAEVKLARSGIENFVLRGMYTAAPLNDPRQGAFLINYKKSSQFKEEMLPASDTKTTDELEARLDELHPLLMKQLYQARLTEEQAEHAIRETGKRLSRDIDMGALRFVEFSRTQIFNDLIKCCLNDEVRLAKQGVAPTSLSTTEHVPQEFRLESAVHLVGNMQQPARTTLALVGMLGIGSISVAQLLNTDALRTNQLISMVQSRLVSSDKIFAKGTK